MQDICQLIARVQESRAAQHAKQRAFGEIVSRFQDLAYAYAYATLGDFDLAQDAAQEAFVCAWRHLDQLRVPEAFPGWFKRIVMTQCNRMTRGKHPETVALDRIADVPVWENDPFLHVEREERRDRVFAAIAALPERERLVTTLFYINDYSQNEIAAFLEVPVTTVKKRLYCARKQLREGMLDMVRETLQKRRPSNDDQFATVVQLFNEALDCFIEKIKPDPYILAAILGGSLSHDSVWHKSDIDLILVGKDEKKPVRDFCLVENGINIHAVVIPRHRFKEMLEGELQSSFFHSYFSKSTLLFSKDDTLREYYVNASRIGARDREMQLLTAACSALYMLYKAEKWFHVKRDLTYSFLWILYCANELAKIETIQHHEVTAREVMHQALQYNPEFFNAIYTDLVNGKKDEEAIMTALKRINGYLDERLSLLFKPVLDFLSAAGGARTTTELDEHFKKKTQSHSLGIVYEYLADKGVIQKVGHPVRLHEKSKVTVEEAAYYYDGDTPFFA